MTVNQQELTLAERIAAGDPEAEKELFFLFKERIQLLVRIRLRGKAATDDQKDILSEIYQAVLISLRKGGFNPELGKPLEAYIAGITGNVVAQYFRKQKKDAIKVNLDSNNHIENSENILTDIIKNEQKEKIQACLYKIKPKYLEVLILRVYEDKTIDEISNILKIERRRVSERINYAFKLLLKECKKKTFFNN